MGEYGKDLPAGSEDGVERTVEDEGELDDAAQQSEYKDPDKKEPSIIELATDELTAVAALAKYGIVLSKHQPSKGFLTFDQEGRFGRDSSIPREHVPVLLDQLKLETIDHPLWVGFLQPSIGYAEFVTDPPSGLGSSAERLIRMDSDSASCAHAEKGKQLPTVPFKSRIGRSESITERIHLVGPSGTPCVELSNASPLATLLYGRGMGSRILLTLTVKFAFGEAQRQAELIKNTDLIMRSLAYELDVRNGRVISARRRQLPAAHGRPALMRTRTAPVTKVRYPKTRLQHEVADLFGFARQAVDNPPLAFLSYYQTLEYFLPAANRQSVLKKVRLELRDPTFDQESDSSLLRLISTAENAIRLPEANQLRTLVHEYVRKDRLEAFFAIDWGNHFTNHGPISGVENVNPKNPNRDLSDQVADRVYRIRNRIVHAKDDPRYQEARVLLPRSQEAQALGPDVELIRLLAMEAIVAAQGA